MSASSSVAVTFMIVFDVDAGIISSLLLIIRQTLVRFGDILEFNLGRLLRILRLIILIRMPFECLLAVGLLDVIIIRTLSHTQNWTHNTQATQTQTSEKITIAHASAVY
jgi:hypothetical protein